MNPWYVNIIVNIIERIVLLVLLVCLIILIVMLIRAKKQHKVARTKGLLLSFDIIFFVFLLGFVLSHSTYYKYNDWSILNSNINSVINKYGVFDTGSIQEGKSGRIGYYIYTDNGPIMPDHMPHYYWIHFDESGTVYKVEVGLPLGG